METLITNIRNDEYSWVTDKNIAIGLETLSIDELLANIRRLIDDEKDILAYVDLCSFVIEKIRTVEFGRLLTLIRRDKQKWTEYNRNDWTRTTYIASRNEDLKTFEGYRNTLKTGLKQIDSALSIFRLIFNAKIQFKE